MALPTFVWNITPLSTHRNPSATGPIVPLNFTKLVEKGQNKSGLSCGNFPGAHLHHMVKSGMALVDDSVYA